MASSMGAWLATWAVAAALAAPLTTASAAEDDFTYSVVHHFSKKADGKNFPRALYSGVMLASDGSLYGLSTYGGHHDLGAAFRISPQTGETAVLHAFGKTGKDGRYPSDRLIELEDGHFIGVAPGGGEFDCGMVYRMHPEGHIRPLHDFSCGKDGGQYPGAPPILAADGWRYGVTGGGGARDAGTVYRLGSNGEFELLYSFDGRYRGDGESPIGPLVLAPDGWFYGVTAEGGSNGRGVLFRIASDGRYERLHDFNNGQGGSKPGRPLMLASDGRMYGSTRYGGDHGWGTIFRVRPDGRPEALHAIDSDKDGLRVTGALTEGPDGYLYFMLAWGAGTEANRQAPLMRLNRETGATEIVGRLSPDRIGTEVYGTLAAAPDGSLYGTTLLPDGGVVFRFAPK
ncbi:choice-of-anchor tandem repeat GloVer-containing protein [Ideonella sp. YS5]